MSKQTAEEIRREVLEEDGKRDISIYLSIPIGIVAGVSALAAVCAVISMRALLYFRQGVDAYWMSCVPFLFPAITGLFAAYKKQFSLLGVHVVVNILAVLMGGFGFALSVEPIFFKRDQCVAVHPGMNCNRTTLAYLYLVTGSVAAGGAALGLLMTLCGLRSATSRISKRREAMELEHIQEQERKEKELRQMKAHGIDAKSKSTISASSPGGAANGFTQGSHGNATNPGDAKTGGDVSTKL